MQSTRRSMRSRRAIRATVSHWGRHKVPRLQRPLLRARGTYQTETAYRQALGKLADDASRTRGVDIGERAAADVLAKHTDDLGNPEPYRPPAAPGVYVPTTFPL